MARVNARRGEIWLVDLGMAQKVRPVLILSVAYKDNERAVVSFVGRTTSMRNTEYEVRHTAPQFEPGAFDVQGINTMPDVQLIRKLAVCDPATLAAVEEALMKWLMLR
jgi:mRNA interferase MazF